MNNMRNASCLFFAAWQRIIHFSIIFFLVILFMQINLFAQVETGSFRFEGITREYLVFLPRNYNDTAKMPVVFNLHGSGLDGQWTMDYTQMNTVADTAGFIVVYPNGVIRNYRLWFYDTSNEVNDVGFFSALIDTLDKKYSIDLEKVYACGFSMGGWMSCKLACQLSQRITAVATIAGGIAEGVANNNDAHHPIPVLSIHGTADPAVPYETGRPDFHVWDPEQTVNFWADLSFCSEPDTISIPDSDTLDGCTVEKITYKNGCLNSRVLFYKVIGGGHTWPGAAFSLEDWGNGKTNQDINANVEIWKFFKDYKLSDLFLRHDLMVKPLPVSNVPILANVRPMVVVKNNGLNDEFDAIITCEIDSAGSLIYSDSQAIGFLRSFERDTVVFKNWRSCVPFKYTLSYKTRLSSDENVFNDTLAAPMTLSNLMDDFESGMWKWSQQAEWGVTANFSHSGKHSLTTGPTGGYKNNSDSWVIFKFAFDFSQLQSAHLSFWTRYFIEKDRDFGFVEVSVDSGQTWHQLGDAYTGFQSNWIEQSRSLTQYCGAGFNDVRIRFRFVSDSKTTFIGWMIDDISIYTTETAVLNNPKLPEHFVLSNNYPNPFNSQTIIEYQVPKAGHVRVSIYNLLGQRVKILVDKEHQPGRFNLIWDGKDYLGKSVPSGIYFYKMEAEGFTETKKMLLLQ